MKSIEDIELLYQEQKHLFTPHHCSVIEGRIKRAIWEGVHVVLTEETFLELPEEERKQWTMIPLKPFYYWARGPICGYVTTDMDDLESEEDEFWNLQKNKGEQP